MSKELEEIIKEFKAVSEMYPSPVALHNAIYRLSELAKPVHYVVEIEHRESNINNYWFRLTTNNVHCFGGLSLAICKREAHNCLNKAANLLGLPPITIEQITFEEV